MHSRICAAVTAFLMASFLPVSHVCAAAQFVEDFKALRSVYDLNGMTDIVKEHRSEVPEQVRALMDEAFAVDMPKEQRLMLLDTAEFLADEYKNITGDFTLLKEVKKRVFEAKLSAPVWVAKERGFVIVRAVSTKTVSNSFTPDNIIIKRGDTVKWLNNDSVAHLLASMPLIGEGGLFSPKVEPGESWQYTFNKPGEYYYICFIHRIMYGKITVQE